VKIVKIFVERETSFFQNKLSLFICQHETLFYSHQ
jgi:hypothetical protein